MGKEAMYGAIDRYRGCRYIEALLKRSKDFQLTDVGDVVISGPEPPGWPVTGGQHQDREQCRRDGLEPRSGQQHPPVESLHRGRIKKIEASLSSLPKNVRVRATTISRSANAPRV